MKIICADRVSVELPYDDNFKWHMPVWGEIWGVIIKIVYVLFAKKKQSMKIDGHQSLKYTVFSVKIYGPIMGNIWSAKVYGLIYHS